MTPNELIDALKRLPAEVMDRPIMDGGDPSEPGWTHTAAEPAVTTREYLANGDLGIIPDPDTDPDENLENESEENGMRLRRELRAVLALDGE